VHPESYPVVRRILTATGSELDALIGRTATLRALDPSTFVDDTFGLPTVTDILSELEKPGRDPRPAFTTATFAEGVNTINDLEPGMRLEGVVTNVAAFGAFVDVGVHQDGLVHISAMSKSFVKDPRDVVKPGDVVRVKVLDVDVPRKRISLTLRLDDPAEDKAAGDRAADAPRGRAGRGGGKQANGKQGNGAARAGRGRQGRGQSGGGSAPSGALADALRRAGYDTNGSH